jgi:hypothetical protein
MVSLRHFKKEVKEIASGNECGILLGDVKKVFPGCIIHCIQTEFKTRKLT